MINLDLTRVRFLYQMDTKPPCLMKTLWRAPFDHITNRRLTNKAVGLWKVKYKDEPDIYKVDLGALARKAIEDNISLYAVKINLS